MDIAEKIKPFFLSEYEDSYSLLLNAGAYKPEIFERRSEEGFEGSGYDWGSLALVFLTEKMPKLLGDAHFDPEAGMFCVRFSSAEARDKFALGFFEACENDSIIADLFSRAELD